MGSAAGKFLKFPGSPGFGGFPRSCGAGAQRSELVTPSRSAVGNVRTRSKNKKRIKKKKKAKLTYCNKAISR